MPVIAPPTITAVPTPAPQRGDRTTFSGRVDAFITWINAAVAQFSAVATNVAANATDAATSATTATTQASTATTQASNSSASAAASSVSASTASSQATNVLAMDKRYLGSKSVAPTLDNQGAALTTGAVYYDTVLAKVRTWNGTAWVDGIASVAGVTSVNGADGVVVITPVSLDLVNQFLNIT